MGFSGPLARLRVHCVLSCKSPVAVNQSEKTLIADLLITTDHSCVAVVCTGLQTPNIQAGFLSTPCPVLRRIAFPVALDWYQWRHNCLTIVLGSGTHMKDVQHLVRQARIQLILDCYSRWIPSVDRNTADGRDESLG
jgi:hypothetical protein